MLGIDDLPHLVSLLEDDNPVVRAALKEALAGFGDGLYDDLRAANIVLEASQREVLESLRSGLVPDAHFEEEWAAWVAAGSGREERLETGLGLLSWAVRGDRGAVFALGEALDHLATRYLEVLARRDHVAAVHSLAEFLFKACGFRGDDRDYYLPRNSDLLSVIDRRLGNPISLACVYRLVGVRAGLVIGACNFPGHFMARTEVEEQVFLVDCFNGGRFVGASDLRSKLQGSAPFIDAEPEVDAVVQRAVLNLMNAYSRLGDDGRMEVYRRLAEAL